MTDKETRYFGSSIILFLFFFSGASALIYEVVWGRMLTLVFGGTAFAISTVLAAFMAGLALGSYLFGRLIDRRGNPLLVYGLLEGGIGAWALLVPSLLDLLNSGYGLAYRGLDLGFYQLSLLRFALTFIVILVPTTLMGGTLPVLMRLLTRSEALVGRTSALLYFANTSGAVAGTFLAGFALIPALGLGGTTHLAVAINFVVTILALTMAKREPARATRAARPARSQRGPAIQASSAAGRKGGSATATTVIEGRGRAVVLVVYAVSGFTALAYEVVWTRALESIVGTTTYAFTTMLTTFLLGLALGSFIFSRLADRFSSPRLLAALQLLIGISALATIPVLGRLPDIYLLLHGFLGQGWWGQVGLRFLLCMLTMLPATVFLGGTFPVVAKLYAGNVEGIGSGIGKMYAFNTVGAIFGSFLAGFAAIPLMGQHNTLVAGVGLNVLAAVCLVAAAGGPSRSRALIAAASAASLLLAAGVSRYGFWDKKIMSSGVYVYASEYHNPSGLREMLKNTNLLYFNEGIDATVSVMQAQGVRFLRINGKTDASNGADMLTQRMIGALPLILHPHPRTALLLGLASGVSAGSMLRHPIERLECVEIVRGMDAAADIYSKENYNCMSDPRFNLIEEDGRNYLLFTENNYDVIVGQVSNAWVSGCVNLFTEEFFQLARRHLNRGGIMCQWIQLYAMSERDLQLILNTFHSVFPHVSVWSASLGDLVVIGTMESHVRQYGEILEAIGSPGVTEDLASVGLAEPAGFFSCFLLDRKGLREYLKGITGLVTDDNPSIEFTMSRVIGQPTESQRLAELFSHAKPLSDYFGESAAEETQEELDAIFEAREIVISAVSTAARGQVTATIDSLDRALEINPRDVLGTDYLSRILSEYATTLLTSGELEKAVPALEKVRRLGHPYWSRTAANNLGSCYVKLGMPDRALAVWRSVLEESPEANYNLGVYYDDNGHADSARVAYEKAIELDPYDWESMNNLSWLLAEEGTDLDRALTLALRSTELSPSVTNMDTLGWVYYKRLEFEKAARALERCIATLGEAPYCLYHLGLAYAKLGREDDARKALIKSADLAGDGPPHNEALEALNDL
jgi:spermidine synthase